jgi:predicted dehydrogenase
MSKSSVRVGMLGAGFIGQMHSLALRMAGAARQQPRVAPQLALLVDRDEALGCDVAERYEWERLSGDVEALAQEPLDLFVNAGPNDAHIEATVRAAQQGVHVFCEKPLARTADEALELWRAVRDTGVQHRCAFVHRFIPSLRVARELIAAGELGEVRHVRAQFLLDMVEPDGSLSWRFDRARAGAGALGDLGSHHIDVARFLVGEVVEVGGVTRTWCSDPSGAIADVNDDAFACTALLENGATATFEASRVASGHSLTGRVEVDGTKGSLAFDMERLNELVIREPRRGPRVQSIPRADDPYDGFWLPGGIQGSHPVGWQECFAHQAHEVLGLASGRLDVSVAATFEDGYRVGEIVDAIEDAARARAWRAVSFRT